MQKLNQLADGLWHIEQFFSVDSWEHIRNNILNIPESEYQNRHEPMRIRLEIQRPTIPFYQSLTDIASDSVSAVSHVTKNKNLRNPPGLFLWRDFAGFRSDWHPDDFTRAPTAQIYVDGEEDQGTSFVINGKEHTIPFKPNTGYLMDNRYQIVHGMLAPVREKIRQSIYLIY